MAIGYWPGGLEPAAASCRLDADGGLTVVTGAVDMTGTETVFAAIAAEAFGLPVEQVRVVAGDTAGTAYAGISGGSKVTYTVGRAVERQLRIDIAQGFEPDVGYVAEDGPHMAPRHGMALAHEARSDQRNAQRRHDNPRPKKAGPDFRRDLHLRQQKTDLI